MTNILQRLLPAMVFLFSCMGAECQSALNVKLGLIDRVLNDESGLTHYGFNIGLDAIVEDTRFLFVPGFHYQRYAVIGSDSRSRTFQRQASIHQISLPVSAGTWILADQVVKVRVYGGIHFNFIVGVDSNNAGINLDRLTTFHPGWQAGVQLLLWRFTADVRYTKDYRKLIKARPESDVRGWEFLIGFAF